MRYKYLCAVRLDGKSLIAQTSVPWNGYIIEFPSDKYGNEPEIKPGHILKVDGTIDGFNPARDPTKFWTNLQVRRWVLIAPAPMALDYKEHIRIGSRCWNSYEHE